MCRQWQCNHVWGSRRFWNKIKKIMYKNAEEGKENYKRHTNALIYSWIWKSSTFESSTFYGLALRSRFLFQIPKFNKGNDFYRNMTNCESITLANPVPVLHIMFVNPVPIYVNKFYSRISKMQFLGFRINQNLKIVKRPKMELTEMFVCSEFWDYVSLWLILEKNHTPT